MKTLLVKQINMIIYLMAALFFLTGSAYYVALRCPGFFKDGENNNLTALINKTATRNANCTTQAKDPHLDLTTISGKLLSIPCNNEKIADLGYCSCDDIPPEISNCSITITGNMTRFEYSKLEFKVCWNLKVRCENMTSSPPGMAPGVRATSLVLLLAIVVIFI